MPRKILLIVLIIACCPAFSQPVFKFHQAAILADTHNDILSIVAEKGYDIGTNLIGKTHSDLRRFKTGGVDIQVFSIFCDERYGNGTAFNHAIRELDSLRSIASRNADEMEIVHNPNQLNSAIRKGKLACLSGVEGGHMIEEKIEYLDTFYNRGVRYMTLTWNNSTPWATSAADESRGRTPFGSKGLTAFGKEVVARMNQLGIMVDLSHVGEQTFYDAISVTSKPVIASHSSVYKLCPHPRNLNDDQIRAIAKTGGVIFINFYSEFIDSTFARNKEAFLRKHQPETDSLKGAGWESSHIEELFFRKYSAETELFRPPLEKMIDHFDYVIKLVGVNHVGIGSDFDGIESAPKELNGVEDFPKVTQALLNRGYSKKDLRKILGGNFLRVFSAVSNVQTDHK